MIVILGQQIKLGDSKIFPSFGWTSIAIRYVFGLKTRAPITLLYFNIPIGSMYAIYGNIYHQYTPNVSIYIPYMDPMG